MTDEKLWQDSPVVMSQTTNMADQFVAFVDAIKFATPEFGVMADGGVSVEFWDGINIRGVADFYPDGSMVFVISEEPDA